MTEHNSTATSSSKPTKSINSDMEVVQKQLIIASLSVGAATGIFTFVGEPNMPNWLQSVASFFVNWGLSVFFGMIVLCAVIEILKRGIGWFWHHYLEPPLKSYGKILEDEVKASTKALSSDIENKIKQLSEELSSFQNDATDLLKDNLLDSVVSRSEPKYLEKKINLVHEKTYGSHCGKQDGLFSAVRKRLYPYLSAVKPHRSQHNQTVVVGMADGKVVWKETTQFEVHTVAFDDSYETPLASTTSSVDYPLKFKSGGNYVDIKDMILEIYVDGKNVASLQDLLDFDDAATDLSKKISSNNRDVLTIEHIGAGFINFQFHVLVKLEKKKVQVKIYEESYLSEEDNFYLVKREEPTYGSTISISLPSDWEIYNFTVPDEEKWGSPNSTPYKTSNTIVADTNDWVLPGIVVSCNWSRPHADNTSSASSEHG